jgi:AraC family transcriptional regulator, regulatory protein of adaptative response / DNA-3-methyladenine glycosylase II
VIEDFERCYRAVQARDARFDGWFFTAVTSTNIYCRPSCPARTPKPENVRFYSSAAAAQQAGFRACMRCRPDAAPGSPEWNGRADVVARAVKLIGDGTVDREGVNGLARRLGYSPRQLHRLVAAELGTGPLALARAQRAQTARLLLQTTDLAATRVAFAAGFESVRQFNDTVRQIFALTPSELRRVSANGHRASAKGDRVSTDGRLATRSGPAPGQQPTAVSGQLSLRLPFRAPFDGTALLAFLGARAVPGLESFDGETYCRSLRLPHADGVVRLSLEPNPDAAWVRATLQLADLRDLTTAVSRCRRLLDLDADPVAVAEALSSDPLLGPAVRHHPGRRLPGTVDPAELAVRAVVGQQVSVAAARRVAAKLVAALGRPLSVPQPPVTHLFPDPVALAGASSAAFAMPAARRQAVQTLASALADGSLVLDPGAEPHETRSQLLKLPGIGPWTASYVAMRVLGDPDAFMPSDLGIRRAIAALGQSDDPSSVEALAERWRPWRSYAMAHLWAGTPTAEPFARASANPIARTVDDEQTPQDIAPTRRRRSEPMTKQANGATSPRTAGRPSVETAPALYELEVPSRLGTFTVVGDDESVTQLLLPSDSSARATPNGSQASSDRPTKSGTNGRRAPQHVRAAAAQLKEYLARRRTEFDVPFRFSGTAFQEEVWRALADIPYGETISYAELATYVGRPGAFRAVGQANGANPLPVYFPCHRVVASGGKPGGYGGGLDLKLALLRLESLEPSSSPSR